MKTILVIDESPLFREFLRKKLSEFGLEVTLAVNGLDGSVKIRKDPPDLIIMDYFLSRQSSIELLSSLRSNSHTADIPVVMASTKIDRDRLMEVAQYNVRKFFSKPIKVDALLRVISELLGVELQIDDSPCIIEAHYNDEIIFVEIAQGLNKEKIELLRYKITELLELYEVRVPKVLVIMSNIDVTAEDSLKLAMLLTIVVETSGAKHRFIKILTNSSYVEEFVSGRDDFDGIEVTNNLEQAMDGLLGRKAGSFIDNETNVVHQDFLQSAEPKKEKEESFNLRFESESSNAFSLKDLEGNLSIAVVDDDFVIQEMIKTAFSDMNVEIRSYENGRQFIEDKSAFESDLVFLDLMMPEMNGFQVLSYINQQNIEIPIIVLSALSKRETVIKALKFGVKSYMIKPLKPEWIHKKAAEILKMNF